MKFTGMIFLLVVSSGSAFAACPENFYLDGGQDLCLPLEKKPMSELKTAAEAKAYFVKIRQLKLDLVKKSQDISDKASRDRLQRVEVAFAGVTDRIAELNGDQTGDMGAGVGSGVAAASVDNSAELKAAEAHYVNAQNLYKQNELFYRQDPSASGKQQLDEARFTMNEAYRNLQRLQRDSAVVASSITSAQSSKAK